MPCLEPDASGTIDVDAFNQILDLDDDGTHYASSKDMIATYFAQCAATFGSMDSALAATDLRALADLAHFLMGSSATLGIVRVAGSCARMGDVGEASRDPDTPADATTLTQLGALLAEVKRESADAEMWLRRWYAEHGESFPDSDADLTPKAETERFSLSLSPDAVSVKP